MTSHIRKYMLSKMLELQTLNLTNLPTDIQPPLLVTVHLVGEQTGKTISMSSRSHIKMHDWIRQVETCIFHKDSLVF